MAMTWYGNQSEAESCQYGALAVIVPMLERMKVASIIDQHLPADPQAEFGYGSVLSLLMAARLYDPLALSNVADWARRTGADIAWDIPVEKLNDDRLGRALDALFEQRHSILAHLALHVMREFKVPLDALHYDPTHILFTGAYAAAEPRESLLKDGGQEEHIRSDGDLPPAHITKGRSTDDAPKGAVMIHAGILTHVDEWGPLPLFGHTVDGNQNGRTAVDELFALWRKHLKIQRFTIMSDRGTYSVGHLLRLKSVKSHAICSAPWGEFKELFDKHRKKLTWKEASYLSVEQQRRRDTDSTLPQEHYELSVLRHQLKDKESKQEIACRLLFVFSTADQKVVRGQRQKHIDRIREGLEKCKANVDRGGPYSDEASVRRRVAKLLGDKDAARYFTWQMSPLTERERSKLPKPPIGAHLAKHRFTFTFDPEAVQQDEQDDGYSVIVTTAPLDQSADTLFSKFKQQTYSEQVNSEFKGPLAIRPVFLHSPKRIEALMFLMIAVLMLYYLLQRLYRTTVPAKATLKEQRCTTRTILKAFANYALLTHHTRLGREVQPTRLTTRQRDILRQLGFATPAQILSSRLPRAP